MKNYLYFILIIFCSCSNSNPKKLSDNSQQNTIYTNTYSLKQLLDSFHIKPRNIHILIDKSEYTLSVMNGKNTIKKYAVVFGTEKNEDKRMQGDRCTPEGTFHIISKYPHPKWNKFLWLNYPTKDSYKKHNADKQNNLIPMDAKIGGEVGIHGVPEGKDYFIDKKTNWTLGCISLKNKDLDELYPLITKKTDIIIVP